MGRVYFNTRKNIHELNTTYTVLESDSGKVFMLSSTGGAYAITMPEPGSKELRGWNCQFKVLEDTPTGDITIRFGSTIVDGVNDDGQGNVANSTAGTAVSNIIVEAAAKQGDFIDLICDGTSWYFHAVGSVDQAFTTT